MTLTSRILVFDNSPRGLAGRWFPKGLLAHAGTEVVVRRVFHGQRVGSLAPYDGIIISGSPASATDDEPWIAHESDVIRQAAELGMPLLGVCFGSQLLASVFYGRDSVRRAAHPEFGWHTVYRLGSDRLFDDVPSSFNTFQYHMEEVVAQPGMDVLAQNDNSAVQAFRIGEVIWGVQFHFEVTPQAGRDLLRRTQRVYGRFGMAYTDLIRTAGDNPASAPLFHNFIQITQDFRAGGTGMG